MTAPLLDLAGIGLSADGVPVLEDVGFGVAAGSITALLGQNGAGKTTLADLICGARQPDRGSIRLAGTPLAGLADHAVAALGVARIWQHPRPIRGLTVREQVIAGLALRQGARFWPSLLRLPAARRAARAEAEAADALLERFDLAARANRLTEALPLVEQRRVELARALIAGPRLLVLDEPSRGLKPEDCATFGAILRDLGQSGLAILVLEHNMQFVADHCATAVVLHRGRCLARGTPAECLDHPEVQEALLGRRQDAERLGALR